MKLIEVIINGQKVSMTEEQYMALMQDPTKKVIESDGQKRILEKMKG